MVVAVAEATKLPLSRNSRGRSCCRGRREGDGGNDLTGKKFCLVTQLDKFANFSGKAKPPAG